VILGGNRCDQSCIERRWKRAKLIHFIKAVDREKHFSEAWKGISSKSREIIWRTRLGVNHISKSRGARRDRRDVPLKQKRILLRKRVANTEAPA